MIIEPIPSLIGTYDSYFWLIYSKFGNGLGNSRVVLTDPGEAAPIIRRLQERKLHLSDIIITHYHPDHVNGLDELVDIYQPTIYGPDKSLITDKLTHILRDGDSVELSGDTYKVIYTPGHTSDHIVYYCAETGVLFAGDTIFGAGCGRVFTGTYDQFAHALLKLSRLTDETLVYCAHEYTLANLYFASVVEPENVFIKKRLIQTRQLREESKPSVPSLMALEKQTNPFLRLQEPDVIKSAEQHIGRKIIDYVDLFTVLRQWKDGWKYN